MVISVNRITDQGLDKYDILDQALIPSKDFIRNFGDVNDYVEAHVYTKDDRLLNSDYNYTGYSLPSTSNIVNTTTTVNSLIFDPASHLQSLGYVAGDFKIDYRIYRKKLYNLASGVFFISEISSDRTEIRLLSNVISDSTVEEATLNFIHEQQTSQYFKDFLLNFGGNSVVNAVNIALDKAGTSYSIVIKLYQPLSVDFDLKSSLWVVEELADPIQFEVEVVTDPVKEVVQFLGPTNFDINVDDKQAINSTYQTINSIYSTDSLTAYQNVVNKLNDNATGINVNYSDYSNFIHFSSAVERLSNFVYKLQTIEDYKANIATLQNVPNYTSGSISGSIYVMQNNISGIIQKFDGYENYLYTVSESTSWPKTGVYPSYSLYPTTSSVALTWLGSSAENSQYYGGQMLTASVYDLENQDNLIFSVPEFIATDDSNQAYLLFLNMVGQHFDNIWIYIKALNDIHKANNSFSLGISKDLVYTALKSLGLKIYNNNTNQNIFDYFIGNTSGSYSVSGSGVIVSGEDRSKELFKRLYNNLPYLLKSKGTDRGIKALITTFGIPDTILDVIEYGGADKFSDSLEYSYDRFCYALNNANGSNIDLKWAPLTQNELKYTWFTMVPDSIEFRFKPDLSNINNYVTLLQQFGAGSGTANFGVTMAYTQSNSVPSANVTFLLSDTTKYVSSSLTLPIYATGSDGGAYWWHFLLRRNYKYTSYFPTGSEQYDTASIQQYDLVIKNNISGQIGYWASASIYATGSNMGLLNDSWSDYGNLSNHCYLTIGGPSLANAVFPSGSNFNGQLQELRYWSEPLWDEAFNNHVLSGESYEGNYTGSAFNDLAARFPLGNNLITYDHSSSNVIASVHPNWSIPYSSGSIGSMAGISLYGSAIYGSNLYGAGTGSLPYLLNENNAYFYRFPDQNNYSPIYVTNYTNTPNSGYYSPVNNKVRVVNNSISSSVLSPFLRLENPDTYRTKDVHFTEVSFSPQNEINKDIIAEYGSTLNLDNFIGVPGDQYNSMYVDLVNLNESYYTKFLSKYNYTDYIRLIKSVDNTLFKMIADYVPARTNLSTGITIKSPILERNKVKRFKPFVEDVGENEGDISGIKIYSDGNNIDVNGYADNFITSELPGSVISHNRDFKKNNFNPYLFPTTSIDQNAFNASDFNVQYGAVVNNVTSSIYLKVDKYNSKITSPAEVQDGYYSYKRHVYPRYLGSKSTSAVYNVYTPGDQSYGKNAAIDQNVLKFGWVSTVNPVNINFYNKTTLNLKYLVDPSGSLTELNSQNNNLFEVQNTFKSGDPATISLFDKINPTNQSSLNGVQQIFLGGFSYTPILYRELDETLYFQYLNPTTTQSLNVGLSTYSTNSVKYEYLGNSAAVSIDQQATNTSATSGYYYTFNGSQVFTTGIPISTAVFPSSAWLYSGISASFGHAEYYTASDGVSIIDSGTAPNSTAGSYVNAYGIDGIEYPFNGDPGSYFTEANSAAYSQYGNFWYYQIQRTSTYFISSSMQFSFRVHSVPAGPELFKIIGVVEKSSNIADPTSWKYVASTTMSPVATPNNGGTVGYNIQDSSFFYDDSAGVGMNSDWTFNLNIPGTSVSLSAGDNVRLKFYMLSLYNYFGHANYLKFEFHAGSTFQIYDSNTNISKLVMTGSIGQSPEVFTYDTGSNRGIMFSNSASFQMYTQSVFLPQNLYTSSYSPVTNIFQVQPGDLFRFGQFSSPNSNYYQVDQVYNTPNVVVTFKVTGSIPSSSLSAQSFAILRKVPDETSVILNYNKVPGITSKALLIPSNLELDVLANVANIINPLKVSLGS